MSKVRYEACPGCGAAVGQPCASPAGRALKRVHEGRTRVPRRYTHQLVVMVRSITRTRVVELSERYGETQAEVLRVAIDAGLERAAAQFEDRARRDADTIEAAAA